MRKHSADGKGKESMESRKEWAKNIVFVLMFGYVLSRAALLEQFMLLRRGVLADSAFWEGNLQIMCRGITGIHAATLGQLLFWDILLLLLCMYMFARVVVPRQFMLLCSGVMGKQILYEDGSGNPRETFILYKSRNGEKIGMLRLIKGRFLFWDRYAAFIRKEADSAKRTASVKMKACSWEGARQGFEGTREIPYEDGKTVFTAFYCAPFEEAREGGTKRAVYCGRINRGQLPEWFQKLKWEDFHFRWEDGAYIYFYADTAL